MAWISFTVLAAALANFVLAVAMLWRRHTRPVHFIFFFFSLATGIWGFSNFFLSLISDPAIFAIVGKFSHAIAIFIPFSGLLLSWQFPESYHPSPRKITVITVTACSLALSVLSFTDLIQESVIYKPEGPTLGPGLLYPFYNAFITLLICWIIYNFLQSRRKTISGRERMQANYCLGGLTITLAGAYFCIFILPLITYHYQYYLLGSAWPLAWTSFTAYAICRYRLMDIGVALRNIMVHTITSGALLLCILLPLAFHLWFLQEAPLPPQIVFLIGVAGLGAFYLPRFQKAVTNFVDQWIFRGRYDYETAMIRFGEELRRTFGRNNIAEVAVRQIPIIVQGKGAAIYLPDGITKAYNLISENNLTCRQQVPRLPFEHPLIRRIEETHERLSHENIAYHARPDSNREIIRRTLESCGAGFAVPLVSQGKTFGIMLLGEKQHDNVYTREDIRLLDSLASQLAFALDNTRLYQQIVESQRFYKTILRHMQRAVIAIDADLRVTMLNDRAESLFNCDQEQWLGQSIDTLLPDLNEFILDTFEKQRDQLPREIRLKIGAKSLPCECETSVMRDNEGKINGALIVCQDLSEKKMFEENMRRIDRLASLGTLAAGVAHEIKNPLVSIKTFAQLLPKRHEDPEFRDDFAHVVHGEITRINRLIHDLLNFSRPAKEEIQEVDLQEILERAISLLNNELKRRDIEVIRNYHSDHPMTVEGDPKQLYQVFINILQNAVQFVDNSGPRITVASRWKKITEENGQQEDFAEISITDNGPGIAKKDLTRIFDPFYSTREEGSGLGLAVCHGILHNHNARINVDSTLGEGTVFSFAFPARPPK